MPQNSDTRTPARPAVPARSADGSSSTNAWRRAALRDLPLRLVPQLSRGRATLETLRALAPGSVLPLATLVGDDVLLLAEGHAIARGEIVERDGELAFRVARLGACDD